MIGCHLIFILLLQLEKSKNLLIQQLQLELRNHRMKLVMILFKDHLNVVEFQQKLTVQKIIAYLTMTIYWIKRVI